MVVRWRWTYSYAEMASLRSGIVAPVIVVRLRGSCFEKAVSPGTVRDLRSHDPRPSFSFQHKDESINGKMKVT